MDKSLAACCLWLTLYTIKVEQQQL